MPSVGADAIGAIPFRDSNSDEQYIAVAVREKSNPSFPVGPISVHLLHEAGGDYLDQKTGLLVLPPNPMETTPPPGRDYGVSDIFGNGHTDLFAVRESIGSALQTWWLTVLDRQNWTYYRATGVGNLNLLQPNVQTSNVYPLAIQTWMVRKIDDLAGVNPDARKALFYRALSEWINDNGYGIVDRLQKTGSKTVLRLRTYRGPAPAPQWSRATLHDGHVDWILFFKGPVIRYDRLQGSYSVIINSQSGAWYGARSAISGRRYLWIQDEVLPRILVYDKQARSIEAIMYRQPSNPMTLLDLKRNALYAGETPIAIPRDLKLAHEFEQAKAVEVF